jgi:hypothetical protein
MLFCHLFEFLLASLALPYRARIERYQSELSRKRFNGTFVAAARKVLELVGRSSSAVERLLSRDLDRTHLGSNSRAAE